MHSALIASAQAWLRRVGLLSSGNWLRLWRELLPTHCLLCSIKIRPEQPGICPACRARLLVNSWPCQLCAHELTRQQYAFNPLCADCRSSPPSYKALVPYLYRPPLSDLLWLSKYRGKLSYARILGRLLGWRLAQLLQPDQLPDILLPMPMTKLRRMGRQYNHAELMVTEVSKALHLPVDLKLAQRVRHSKPQAELSASARRRNLRGAFAINKDLADLHVGVVDDVITTGSSVSELSGALLQAGAAQVSVYALLRAAHAELQTV